MTTAALKLTAEGTVDIAEAQRLTSLGRTAIYGLMDRGELAYVKIGKRRLIPRKAIQELLARNLVGQN